MSGFKLYLYENYVDLYYELKQGGVRQPTDGYIARFGYNKWKELDKDIRYDYYMRADMKKAEKLVHIYESGLKEIKHRVPIRPTKSVFVPLDDYDFYDDE